tara:strand:+ start:801 stop:1676 length:876 start_codon:yes stop_codon:yes gene_type:complete
MEIIVYVLYSIGNNFKINHYYKINIPKKIGEGTYGYVYSINKDLVIKIFKNYSELYENDETNLLPKKNENREVKFFIDLLNSKYKNNHHLININAIGIIKYINGNNLKLVNNYCLILPKCNSVTNLINLWKMPLINNKDGKEIVLNFMKRLIEIELFLNKNFNITNLDIKLNNYMIQKSKKLNIDNILAIDFGLVIQNNNIKYDFKKYYIWPCGQDINIKYVSPYSICINALILFLGENKVKNNDNIYNLNYLKKDKDFYNIFNQSLSLKLNCENLQKLIHEYMKKNKFKH